MTKGRSYEERHRDAGEVLRAMQGGDVDVERAATAMQRRHGPLGSHAIDYVLGDVWSRPQLSRRDRSLIVVSLLAAMGSTEELATHVGFGLSNGLSRDEVDEIVLQVATYAGYPMAMAASRVVDGVYCRLDGVDRQPPREPAPAKGDAERRADAADVLRTLTGGGRPADPDDGLAALVDQFGDVGRLTYEWAFGEVWAGDRLSRRDRSLVVVAILTYLGKADELAFHIPAALNHGATREELSEVMVQMCVYGGFPRAIGGVRALKSAFARLDGEG